MDRTTGKPISRGAHIVQSVADIIATPVGTRIMRRDYGSRVPELADAPGNAVGVLRVIAASADAIARWELRVRLRRGQLSANAAGRAVLRLDMITTADSSPLSAEVPVG